MPEVGDDIEFLDRARERTGAGRYKAEVATLLAPAPGETVLEIGTATGEALRSLVSTGAALGIGIDVSHPMLIEARRRGSGDGVEFVVGDATRLPLRSETIDACNIERVLQHVPTPAAAMAEVHRVLRPGGRFLILEPDQELRVVNHPDAELDARFRRFSLTRFENPTIGRHLYQLARHAGFSVEHIEVVSLWSTDWTSFRGDARVAVAAAVDGSALTSAEAKHYLSALDDLGARDQYFSIWTGVRLLAVRR